MEWYSLISVDFSNLGAITRKGTKKGNFEIYGSKATKPYLHQILCEL